MCPCLLRAPSPRPSIIVTCFAAWRELPRDGTLLSQSLPVRFALSFGNGRRADVRCSHGRVTIAYGNSQSTFAWVSRTCRRAFRPIPQSAMSRILQLPLTGRTCTWPPAAARGLLRRWREERATRNMAHRVLVRGSTLSEPGGPVAAKEDARPEPSAPRVLRGFPPGVASRPTSPASPKTIFGPAEGAESHPNGDGAVKSWWESLVRPSTLVVCIAESPLLSVGLGRP